MDTKRVKVWDLVVRGTHLLFAGLVLAAFLTSDSDENTVLHTRLGLGLLGVVALRVIWGFVGSGPARFTAFVRSPSAVLAELRSMVRGKPHEFVSHNPVGAVMVVALLVALVVVTVTGVLVSVGPEWSGPLLISKGLAAGLKEVHEVSAWTLAVMVGFHVVGVILSSVLEKQNLVTGMITGFKRVPSATTLARPALGARAAGFALSVVVGAAIVLALWRLLPIGEAKAATPLQAVYEQQARKDDPAFMAFDPARGKAFYFAVHQAKGGALACATCHTDDPTKPGKSPVGKNIEPLAPSATPTRFTDQGKTDKWFDRNCKQVLGRVCTARERGDVLAWLLTQK
jgi:cytochrome b